MTTEASSAQGPEKIMELTSGLWVSKTLSTALDIDLFGTLTRHPGSSVAELAEHLGFDTRPTRSLLTACAALGLITKDGGHCFNSPLSQRYLVRGAPDYFGGWVEMLERHDYPGWMRLTESLRANRPTAWDPARQKSLFDDADPVVMETFWEAMYAVSTVTARAFAARVGLGAIRALLDVGGGGAAWDIELCRTYPDLRAAVVDLPFVCELTRPGIEKADLTERITTVPGDFFTDPLPTGYDAVLLSSILHDWDETADRAILRQCFQALPTGGRLIVSELFVADSEDGPLDAALMGLAMQVETWGHGLTVDELTGWLTDTGFTGIQVHRFTAPTANGVVIAHRP
ncbi:methyltransferase [Streptomyces cyaneofuscatus]|uniref:methyltransferase n=1 Tax=Streptomyces cyaneofuscatus TaxID=66883 RepID=UPI0037A91608